MTIERLTAALHETGLHNHPDPKGCIVTDVVRTDDLAAALAVVGAAREYVAAVDADLFRPGTLADAGRRGDARAALAAALERCES